MKNSRQTSGWQFLPVKPANNFIKLLLMLASVSMYANNPPPFNIYHLTVQEGLIQNAVISMKEDSRGFLWIGSEFGLSCYDGHQFHRYTHTPGRDDSLSHPIVFDIAEDRDGNLWFGTQKGLSRLDFRTQRFSHYLIEPEQPERMDRNWVYKIFPDGGNQFWLGTQGNGLIRFDAGTGRIMAHYKHQPERAGSISHNVINDIYEDREGTIWIATEDGINRFIRESNDFICYKLPGNPRRQLFTELVEDTSGRLWVGSKQGLFLLDKATGRFAFPFENRPTGAWLKSSLVSCMILDPFGFLWVGTRIGLNRIDTGNLEVTRYLHDHKNPMGISHNHIWDMLVDANGVLWIATYGGGLNKIVFQTKPFHYFTESPGYPGGLSYACVLSVMEDESGIVWLGTRGGGLNRWDRNRNQCRWYQHDHRNPESIIANDVPIIIQSDREPDILWIGTQGGVDRFNKKTEEFTHFRNDPNRNDSLSNNQVYALLEDQSGILWVGTWGGGLNRFDRQTGTFDRYLNNPNDSSSISSNVIWDLYEDRQGRLWIGTGGGGLDLMERNMGSFKAFEYDHDKPESLCNNYILCIHEDSLGIFWLGTLDGLNRFDSKTGRCVHYTVDDGLPDNVIYGILEDEQGNLWCSTNKGLSRFNPGNRTFRNYSPSDGLQSYEFNQHSYWKNGKGEFYFGGINGLNIFTPSQINDNPRVPPVYITGLKIFNRPVPITSDGSSPLSTTIMTTSAIRLSYRKNSLTFEFSALDFTFPERNQYGYKLEGVDSNWVPLGNKHEITFAHLTPGKYTLRIKGSNSDGVWNEKGALLNIVITPPFWQTWWLRLLLLLILIFAILGFYRFRLQRVTRRLKTETAMERFFNKKGISSREREIVLLILKGRSNKQIEDELFISMGTVKNHVYNIFRKLEINSRIQLINLFKNLNID